MDPVPAPPAHGDQRGCAVDLATCHVQHAPACIINAAVKCIRRLYDNGVMNSSTIFTQFHPQFYRKDGRMTTCLSCQITNGGSTLLVTHVGIYAFSKNIGTAMN